MLERCLHSEQTVDQLNDKNNDLKKKLNDAQSAMHELGRENQALQVPCTVYIIHNTPATRMLYIRFVWLLVTNR